MTPFGRNASAYSHSRHSRVARLGARLPAMVVAALIACVLLPPAARCDTVDLLNGATMEGEVVADQKDEPLRFRYRIDGRWKTTAVARPLIRRVTREPGDQSDGRKEGAAPAPVPPGQQRQQPNLPQAQRGADAVVEAKPAGAQRGADVAVKAKPAPERKEEEVAKPLDIPGPRLRNALDLYHIIQGELPPKEDGQDEIVILTLRGPVEDGNLQMIGKIISYPDFLSMMAAAEERSPRAIVLAIDSPGGLVAPTDDIIERILESQTAPRGHRVVAWVNLGGSAAALMSMACKEIVMTPQGRLGAATAVIGEIAAPPPMTDLDQKIAAMRDARRRQVVALTNRPKEIQQAMEQPAKQLYWHSEKGFSDAQQKGNGWIPLDEDTKQPLALEAGELKKYGIAEGIAGSTEELLDLLGLPEGTKCIRIDLDSDELQAKTLPERLRALNSGTDCITAANEMDKKLRKLFDNIDLALRVASKMKRDPGGFTPADRLSLQNAIRHCRIPVLSKETEELLKYWAPVKLAKYQVALQLSKERVASASRSVYLMNSSIPIGAIIDDLTSAGTNVMRGMDFEPIPVVNKKKQQLP